LTSLESIDAFIDCNRTNYCIYRDRLVRVEGLRLYPYEACERRNYQYVILEVDFARLSRDDVQHILQAENVLARRYFYPGCHQMEPYRSTLPDAGLRLPATQRLVKRVLSLPTGPNVTPAQVEEICDLLRFVAENREAVARRLEKA
jgi:dTDP-4-amino-4,6-dideoxygalactose transaminase